MGALLARAHIQLYAQLVYGTLRSLLVLTIPVTPNRLIGRRNPFHPCSKEFDMNKLVLTLSLLATAVSLVACGGGDDTPTNTVASSDLSVNLNASDAPAIKDMPFTFPSGVADFGTTDTTTLTLSGANGGATNTFTLTGGPEHRQRHDLSTGRASSTVTAIHLPGGQPESPGGTVGDRERSSPPASSL